MPRGSSLADIFDTSSLPAYALVGRKGTSSDVVAELWAVFEAAVCNADFHRSCGLPTFGCNVARNYQSFQGDHLVL